MMTERTNCSLVARNSQKVCPAPDHGITEPMKVRSSVDLEMARHPQNHCLPGALVSTSPIGTQYLGITVNAGSRFSTGLTSRKSSPSKVAQR